MTFTIEVSDETMAQLVTSVPAGERHHFMVAAIADGLAARLRSQLGSNPALDNEINESLALLEQVVTEGQEDQHVIAFEEACFQWQKEHSAQRAKARA